MPVKLRLKRQGRKGRPFFHIVAADSRSPRDGRIIERIGSYNPVTNPASIDLDSELALKWLKNGAQPTDTVRAILRYTGVNLKHALHKQGKDEETTERIFNAWLEEQNSKIQAKKDSLAAKKDAELKEQLERERKVREAKLAAAAPAPEVEAPAEEATEEVEAKTALEEAKEELKADSGADAPAPEAKVEAPAEEAAPEAPAKEEAATPEAKTEEAPAEEAKEEAAPEEEKGE